MLDTKGINFYNKMTALIDGRRAVDIIYPDNNKVFDIVSRKNLIENHVQAWAEQAKRWTENCLNILAQGMGIDGNLAEEQ